MRNKRKHNRRSIRLKGYDYTSIGYYFITICTQDRKCLFGNTWDNKAILNRYGIVAYNCWQAIPEHFSHVELDIFVIMPNHIHGILVINQKSHSLAMPNNYEGKYGKPIAGSIPTIVGSYKSAVTKQINLIRNTKGAKVWQRNYYESVIRDEKALNNIRQYIINNPLKWERDRLYPKHQSIPKR